MHKYPNLTHKLLLMAFSCQKTHWIKIMLGEWLQFLAWEAGSLVSVDYLSATAEEGSEGVVRVEKSEVRKS